MNNLKFYCPTCKENYLLQEDDLFPHRGWDGFVCECLIFSVRCPKCHNLYTYEELDEEVEPKIPYDMKLRLMKKYAGIADETIDMLQAKKKYEDAMKEYYKYLEKLNKKKLTVTDNSRLYSNWYESDNIIKENKSKSKRKEK